MPNQWPSIDALFRQVERATVNTSSTHRLEPNLVPQEQVLPLQTLTEEPWKMAHAPQCIGPNTFPGHPLFARLVRFAHRRPPRICVRDDNTGVEVSHVQLLTDVLVFRERVWRTLSDVDRTAMEQGQEVYVAVLAAGGYEFTVAVLAVLALGAAVVPLTVALPAEEALYFISKSKSVAVLVSEGALRLGLALEKLVKNENARSAFVCIPIAPALHSPPLHPDQIIVSSDVRLDNNAPGVLIFTSGTTGRPKGAVMRRTYIHDEPIGIADHYRISESDVLLHIMPVHHSTGMGMMFFPFLVSGALLEFKSGGFDAEWVWNRWRTGGITFFSGVPTVYMRLMRYFQQNLSTRRDADRYVSAARSLRVCICGTSALPKPIADFWTQLLGKRILQRYGATESGVVVKMYLDDPDVPDGSVGTLFAGCDVRLSEGNEGEVLVKAPGMFSKYLDDPEATAASHTHDGYYRTGDVARKEGGYYWILGRASVDIIKSGGYKISALEIEREVLALPYVAEVMVVGVPDDEFGERVAAVVWLKDERDLPVSEREMAVKELKLDRLRQDLRARLAGYKLPTMLRVTPDELPKSGTGKIAKKVLGPLFFPTEKMQSLEEVQIWRRGEKDAKSKL